MLLQTLEIEWFLRGRCKGGPCRLLIDEGIADLESFVRSFVLSGFRPIASPDTEDADIETKRATIDVLAGLHEGFAYFYGEKPEKYIAVSREKMMRGPREEQAQHYANMRHGSFSERAVTHPRIQELRKQLGRTPVAYNGAPRNLTLDRALRTCFNTSGVTSVLKENLNAAFSKLVENEIVTVWHARLGLAAVGDTDGAASIKKLTEALKRTSPFGAVHTGAWQAFYLVE